MVEAPHNEEDIVKPTTDRDEPLMLSKSSEASAVRFVERDLWWW